MRLTPYVWRSGDLKARWKAVLHRLYDGNYELPDRDPPVSIPRRYRFEIIDVGEDGASLIVHAFFQVGERYCCADPVCHWPILGRGDWELVREEMAEECIDHLNPVLIREWRVTVEAGSRFFYSTPHRDQVVREAAYSYCVRDRREPDEY